MAVSYVRRAQSIVIQANSSRPDPIHAVDLTRCYARSKVAIPLHGRYEADEQRRNEREEERRRRRTREQLTVVAAGSCRSSSMG
eukprot:764415-Hanusia_phi.AAC.1